MTSDADEFDELKAAMRAATPDPDPEARAKNMALARENFARRQGSANETRQTSVTAQTGLFGGLSKMLNTLTSRGGLTATTALVAVGLLFLTPTGQNILTRPDSGGSITVNEVPVGGESQPTSEADDAKLVQSEQLREVETAEEVRLGATTEAEPATDFVAGSNAPVVEMAPAVIAEAPTQADLGRTRTDTQSTVAPSPAPRRPAPSAMADAESAPLSGAIGGFVAPAPAPAEDSFDRLQQQEPNTEAFANAAPNPLKITSEEPVSTFSIDVDTAAYAVLRSSLTRGYLPSADAVRIEELINYFPYDYPAPGADEAPFRPTVSVFETPWNPDTQLVHIAIQGEMPALEDRPPLNLVFLIDTSGSMNQPNKLPLLKQSFRLMLDQLRPEDQVAIVAYAGSSGQVLAPTAASERETILGALSRLRAGGGTNGQGGLQQAYSVAEAMSEDGEVSRIILATDGDFNVGLSDPNALEDFIAGKRETGTYLSVLGFGRGNLDDATMQALAQNGNGTAAFIDSLSEAQKVLVDQLTGALFPIANDVKIQVEFNPGLVAEYRLIGYETRALKREDFNNDKVDAGELGAGHSVTAIYEITPVGSAALLNDPLRYGTETTEEGTSGELGFLRLRYKEPGAEVSQLIETQILPDSGVNSEARFAAAIAGFGQLLRDDSYLGDWGYEQAINLANANRGEDEFGYRSSAVQLMRLAQSLSNN